jgi:hypothetical protein
MTRIHFEPVPGRNGVREAIVHHHGGDSVVIDLGTGVTAIARVPEVERPTRVLALDRLRCGGRMTIRVWPNDTATVDEEPPNPAA